MKCSTFVVNVKERENEYMVCPWALWPLAYLPICGEAIQFSSVAQSCPTLCDPMNCNTPGLPIHHQFPEFTQTHVNRVGDAIQLSHPLLSLLLLPPIPPRIRVFFNDSTLRMRWPKYWSSSFSIIPSILVWRIRWTGEPGGLQSIGSQRVGHD